MTVPTQTPAHVLTRSRAPFAAGHPGRSPPGSTGLMIGLGPGVSVELVLLRW